MTPHLRTRIVIVRTYPATLRWHVGWLMVVLCLLTLFPGVAQAQVMLPVVIKLPPSFLQTAPSTGAEVEMAAPEGVVKRMVGVPTRTLQIAAVRTTVVRATELRGLLPHQYDYHHFDLEATEPGGAFAVTLVVQPETALADDAVNFVVLTEDGMKKFLAGVDAMVVKTAIGRPLLFDQIGNRLTALVPGNANTKHTVIVYNNSKLPVTYTLQVQGGVLHDDAGQTFSAVQVTAPSSKSPVRTLVKGALTSAYATTLANQEAANHEVAGLEQVNVDRADAGPSYTGIVQQSGMMKPVDVPAVLQHLLPEPVHARRLSGELGNTQERHYLNLATDVGGGDVTLTLRYRGASDAPSKINFWVMTQDGVRHLVQGALAQELNLATGLPVPGEPGVYRARLRMAQNILYTVVVFSESDFDADYTLAVEGGILVDRYGQTREARAAEMEMIALGAE